MRKLYKQKLIRIYTSYFFIVLIAGIIAVIVYHEFKIIPVDDFGQNTNTTDLILLTSEEVDAEREKFLPLLEKPKLISSSVGSDTSTSYASEEAELVMKDQGSNSVIEQNIPDGLIMTSEITQADGSIIRSFSAPEATFTAVNEYSSEELTPLVIEGSIINIDNDKKLITVALRNDSGKGTIKFNSETKILINNKPIDFSNLKIADTIRAEGFGDNTTNTLIKTNITIITGFHQLIPTI